MRVRLQAQKTLATQGMLPLRVGTMPTETRLGSRFPVLSSSSSQTKQRAHQTKTGSSLPQALSPMPRPQVRQCRVKSHTEATRPSKSPAQTSS